MQYTRVRMTVEINLDPLPGWNHDPQDYATWLRDHLVERAPHYKPTVSEAEVISEAPAILDQLQKMADELYLDQMKRLIEEKSGE